MNEEIKYKWTIQPQKKSIFSKVIVKEYIEPYLPLQYIKEGHSKDFNKGDAHKKELLKYNNEKVFLEKYMEKYDKQEECFMTSYLLPKHKWGRLVPTDYLSMSITPRKIRHTFCDGKYRDIDMKNSAYTLLVNLCIHNDFDCVELKKYVDDPKQYRADVITLYGCSNEDAKDLFLSLLFGGSYDWWIQNIPTKNNMPDSPTLRQIYTMESEIRAITSLVWTHNQHIFNDVKKENPLVDIKSVMALFYQTWERVVQETAIAFLVENKNIPLDTIIPCQDGFMVRDEDYYEELIDDITNVIKSKYNFNITWTEKLFDEKITLNIQEAEQEYSLSLGNGDTDYNKWCDNLSYKKLAEKFLELYNEKVAKQQNMLYVYYDNRWFEESKSGERYKLSIIISENLFDEMKSLINETSLTEGQKNTLITKLRNNTCNSGGMENIVKHIIPKVKISSVPFDNNPFLIGFENGVFDLIKKYFRPYKYDDYMTMSVGWEYEELDYGYDEDGNFIEDENLLDACEGDEELYNKIMDTRTKTKTIMEMYSSIFPNDELRYYYLQVQASGLDGLSYQNIFLLNGKGGNGKGNTTSLMSCLLGDYYLTGNNGLLKDCEKANSASADKYALKNKRYVIFQEVEGQIKNAILKNMTGGGKMSCRGLYRDTENIPITFTLGIEFNNPPELDSKITEGEGRRIKFIPFETIYTNDVEKLAKGGNYKVANTYFTSEEFRLIHRQVFFDCLTDIYHKSLDKDSPQKGLRFYEPTTINLLSQKYLQDQNVFKKLINIYYRKTDEEIEDEKKWTKLKSVWETIKNCEEYKELHHTKRKMYSRDECYEYLKDNYNCEEDKHLKTFLIKNLELIPHNEDCEEDA